MEEKREELEELRKRGKSKTIYRPTKRFHFSKDSVFLSGKYLEEIQVPKKPKEEKQSD